MIDHKITADWTALMNQAQATGEYYFNRAFSTLRGSGLEYSAADVVALAGVMAQDFHSAAINVAAQAIADVIERGIERE